VRLYRVTILKEKNTIPSPLWGEGQDEGASGGVVSPHLNPLPFGERKTTLLFIIFSKKLHRGLIH